MDPATIVGIAACVMSLAACCTSLGTLRHVTNKINSEKQEKTTVHIENRKVDEEKADGSTIHTQMQKIDIEDFDFSSQSKEQNLLKTGEPNKVAEMLAGGAASGLAAIQELGGGDQSALEVVGGVASSGIALLVAPKKDEDEEKHFEPNDSRPPSPVIEAHLPVEGPNRNMLDIDEIERSITKKVSEIIGGLSSAPPPEEDEDEDELDQVSIEILPAKDREIALEIHPDEEVLQEIGGKSPEQNDEIIMKFAGDTPEITANELD